MIQYLSKVSSRQLATWRKTGTMTGMRPFGHFGDAEPISHQVVGITKFAQEPVI
jgi:hypothetical protein